MGDGPHVDTWWFIVGEDPLAVERVGSLITKRETASAVPFPACDYQDELARPPTHRQVHTWGIEPVHYALEAEDLGVSATRVHRQWSRHAPKGGSLIVADPVNSLRVPWLQAHFTGARFVHATLPESDSAAWTRARSGLSTGMAQEHVRRIRQVLLADLAVVPHETVMPSLPSPPLAG
ncbi:MAG: hypothetical protein ACJAZO_005038 [Myxococcota bacterium]|jgi:hypothetical protein